jgi:putative acid phosphatase of HAD superfamily subfamily IIIB
MELLFIQAGYRRAAEWGRQVAAVGIALLVATFVLAGAGSLAGAATCPPPPYPPASLFGAPDNGAPKPELMIYGCSGRYAQDLAAEIAEARDFVERRAGEVARPALVLDIDETSLSNWRVMLANDFEYLSTGACRIDTGGPCNQRTWELRAQAPAIAPMLALYKAARARGVAVFFLTGRADDPAERAATARNLRRAGYSGWRALILRAPGERKLSAAAFKSARRAQIEAQGYTIIASIGDQWSDLDGGYAERTFKLPNPFYFIP